MVGDFLAGEGRGMSGVSYDIDQWQTWAWESDQRYYCVRLQQNLFGDWCLVCSWGGRFNRLGNSKTYEVADRVDAVRQLRRIDKRRQRRGYQLLKKASAIL